ncbi:dnaJ-like subfamily C member 2 [Melia azedarach]|uniref:DnaJ-like subfamily C member 2 n=1 Tax=Melia azedarach TaxID=155640 RepID=A0ACC1YZY0_MELAZ|nr:dnaJ-like subfamily C member 2 [Melia azedarach]
MEFLDEDTRPRFLFQSRPQPSSLENNEDSDHQKPTKLFLFIFISISCFLIFLSFFFFQSEPLKSILLWLSLSLIVGPFAPSHLTGGQTRVGYGRIIENPVQDQKIEPEVKKKPQKNRSLVHKAQDFHVSSIPSGENSNGLSGSVVKEKKVEALEQKGIWVGKNVEEKEWSEEDIEILKKQMVKNPVGKPKRWEVIAEAFNGKHRVESVIKKAKELGEKKVDDSGSYAQFLKNRKALVVRTQDKNEGLVMENGEESKENVGVGGGWSAGEDIALLNALKAFPKDAPMRWEKIAAAVPGRSKAACMKRVADLKRDFRSSKPGAES